jgi:hypothetical protein
VLQVLVDADNIPVARLTALVSAINDAGLPTRFVVAGRPEVLQMITWPADAEQIPASGWQRADLALAAAYSPEPGPLVLASGDSDFVQLAARHPGPVLVVSEAAAARFRDVSAVVDPVHDPAAMAQWLRAVGDSD